MRASLITEINKVVNKNVNNKLSGEKIVFSDTILKINKKLLEQKRLLIITEEALYNFKENSLKRRIPIKSIKAITVSKTSDEFVIHGEDNEYDYHYKSKKKRKIIQILAAVYYLATSRKLNFALIKDGKLDDYVTVSSDKKKDKNYSKFDEKFSIDIDVYLYGNLLRKNSIRTQQKKNDVISVMNTQKTEIVFLNENNSFNNLKELKIENFRILGSLINSYYGKIFWSEFIDNNFYLMRVINNSDLLNFIPDIVKVTASFTSNCSALTSADCIFKTEDKTFILNKFNPFFEGGFLFYHLKHSLTFNEKKIKIISAQIINIIIYFHKSIEKHMNFSPENFILDKNGFINYLWFEIDEKLFYEKLSPKILKPIEYTKINNDWYNLGVLIYEMLLNINPENFRDKNGELKYPKFIEISDDIKIFIEKLMSMTNEDDDLSLNDIQKYKFFKDINFEEVLNRKYDSEIKPMNLEIQKIKELYEPVIKQHKDGIKFLKQNPFLKNIKEFKNYEIFKNNMKNRNNAFDDFDLKTMSKSVHNLNKIKNYILSVLMKLYHEKYIILFDDFSIVV